MKVMSAIESCRTAALGGHVALRGLRPHDHRLQQLPQPALPQVPGDRGAHMDGGAGDRAAARALFPHCLHAAGRTRRYRLPEQEGDLRPLVQGRGRDHADDRRRPQAPGRQDRHHLSAAHLGLGDDASSACAHDRARRRPLPGRDALDRDQTKLPPARAGALQVVPPPDAGEARRHPQGRQADLLRRACASRRQQRLRHLPGAAQEDALVRLLEGDPSPARRRCLPICRATPTASPSPTAA
jgi:hypothetical protein